jgi:hypothetical protein
VSVVDAVALIAIVVVIAGLIARILAKTDGLMHNGVEPL